MLARRKGADRRPSALALEAAILDRLPERRPAGHPGPHRLPDRLAPALRACLRIRPEDPRQPGPVRGDRVRLRREPGPTEVARHMRGVSAHEIYTAGNKHADREQDLQGVGRRHQRFRQAGRRGDVGRRADRGGGRLPDRHLGEQPAGRVPHPIRRVRRLWRSGWSPTPTSPCSATSSPAGCGRRSTSWTRCCATTPTSSPTQSTPIPRASRCRCSAWPPCWGSICCRGSATGTT